MTNKQILIFACSFIATTFSLLGWLYISYTGPNPYILRLCVPMMIFIAISGTYVTTEAAYGSNNER